MINLQFYLLLIAISLVFNNNIYLNLYVHLFLFYIMYPLYNLDKHIFKILNFLGKDLKSLVSIPYGILIIK